MLDKNILLQEIQNEKELSIFSDTLNSLPPPKKRAEKLESEEKIPIILSSDDNYACFVATTGVSILYNTNSFVEFYVLSEGITAKNKELIRQSFAAITPHFSLEFVECDSKKSFSSIKLREGYYISLSTCNRLLVPQLLPKLKRAIYLDVDLIVLDDIRKLWNENLDGHVFGCVPLFYDRLIIIQNLRKLARIPDDKSYYYFNSGVMLIDYDRWRDLKGSNSKIIEDIFDVMSKCDTQATPDEVVLNKFAYENGGYKVLPLKYNTHTDYTYNFLKANQKKLSKFDAWTLDEFEKQLEYYQFNPDLLQTGNPVVHHYFGSEKPWLYAASAWFPIPFHEHFEDFWFYAKLTLFFSKIKRLFIAKHMSVDYSKVKEYDLTATATDSIALLADYGSIPELKRKQKKYKFLSKITIGKKHRKYKEKYKQTKNLIYKIQTEYNKRIKQ